VIIIAFIYLPTYFYSLILKVLIITYIDDDNIIGGIVMNKIIFYFLT